ncbi:hypothetical protein TEA_020070 [Camellia sinensis var. sinensis]|uniref:Uncharacterized protein n=1 Tax=Camellia sinensis var. sinensis TaxID=542762 RepID=A0A4S4D2C7_CAMSN|nr:hypothetical protein TEA_020070 [Camellia sinensis var. sinensis]
MSPGRLSIMELKPIYDIENANSELWPLGEIDPKKAKFPCCLVWTPLPVVSWLAPFIGHVGICREDGAVLDFSGSNFVNVDEFAYGAVARYLQLDREKCCFPPNLVGHTCKHRYKHAEYGTAITWDDALQSSMRHFEHKTYNLFTCNCHSFIIFAFYISAVLGYFRGWVAILDWTAIFLSPPPRMVSIGYVLYQKSVRLLDACAINADMCLMRNGCYGFVCVPKNSCADLINNIAIDFCFHSDSSDLVSASRSHAVNTRI